MTKTKKTFRIDSVLDVDPAKLGFENFTELANVAIRELIENRKTPATEAAEFLASLQREINKWRGYKESALQLWPNDHIEWLEKLILAHQQLSEAHILKR